MGTITVPKAHVLNKEDTGFSSSACFTELLCYMGQELVFEAAAEVVEKLTLVDVQPKQIERICHCYGQKLEDQLWHTDSAEKKNLLCSSSNQNEPYYVMADGGMVLTREEKWKEMKVCRIFSADDRININKGRNCITQSQYVVHLGDHRSFFNKVEQITDYLPHKIFIADGAKWIWNWVRETYPNSIEILDYFHAKEHLCQFANLFFKDEGEKKKWVDAQCLWLLNDGVEKVLDSLSSLWLPDKQKSKCRDDLVAYYISNQSRMKYKTYRDNGWLIGSGAMEAAHRHVIQQRMKLSGQRWTLAGAQQIANLRALNKSNQWTFLNCLMKNAA